jgi:hypothetical protein
MLCLYGIKPYLYLVIKEVKNIEKEVVSKAEYDKLLLDYRNLKTQLSELQ